MIEWIKWTIVTGTVLTTLAASRAAEDASVLVEVQKLERARLNETLTGYGVVIPDTGSVVGINFPRAGQVSRLLVSAGQIVKRGAPLVELTSDPAAVLAYNQAASAVDLARGELNRVESLGKEQLATQSQRAAARKALSDAEGAFRAQQKLGGAARIEHLAAPFDGLVTAIAVAQGDRIQPGTDILQFARIDTLRVQLGIEPEDIGSVKQGMPVRLTAVLSPGHPVDASVSNIQGTINPQTQLMDVVVRVPNHQSGLLIPGMRVQGVITIGAEDTWAVPRTAILRDESGDYIYQISAGKARRVSVQTGIESDGRVGITGKVDPMLKVVIVGNYELKEGMTVRETTR